jgi:hypothetical protein
VDDALFRIRNDQAAGELLVTVGPTNAAHPVYRPVAPAGESAKPYLSP